MEIGLTYSSSDPRQIETRDFVRRYVRDRGILATIVENDDEVPSPKITINGLQLRSGENLGRPEASRVYPSTDLIVNALEQTIWQI